MSFRLQKPSVKQMNTGQLVHWEKNGVIAKREDLRWILCDLSEVVECLICEVIAIEEPVHIVPVSVVGEHSPQNIRECTVVLMEEAEFGYLDQILALRRHKLGHCM